MLSPHPARTLSGRKYLLKSFCCVSCFSSIIYLPDYTTMLNILELKAFSLFPLLTSFQFLQALFFESWLTCMLGLLLKAAAYLGITSELIFHPMLK